MFLLGTRRAVPARVRHREMLGQCQGLVWDPALRGMVLGHRLSNSCSMVR